MNIEIAVCKKCGRMFQDVLGQSICPVCIKDIDNDFDRVKNFVWDNPGYTAEQVSKICKVPVKVIYKWVREEKLEFSTAEGSGICCERCKMPISTGRFCDKCKAELRGELKEAVHHDYKVTGVKTDDTDSKMRFLNKR